jgi:hypothetical protein
VTYSSATALDAANCSSLSIPAWNDAMYIRLDTSDLRGCEPPCTPRDNRGYGWFMILVGLGGVIAGGFLAYPHRRTLEGYVQERTPVSLAKLSKIESPDELSSPYVSLPPAQVIDTGVRRSTGRRRVQVNYVLVPVGNRYLLTEVHFSHRSGTALSGHLEQWQPNRNGGGILDEVKARGYGKRLLPYQLGAVGDGGMPVDAAIGPLVILAGLVFVGFGFFHLRS